MTTLATVPFRAGDITVTTDQRVALKPVCEAMGLDFSGQRQRLQRTPWAGVGMTPTTGTDGKTYQMVTIDRRTPRRAKTIAGNYVYAEPAMPRRAVA